MKARRYIAFEYVEGLNLRTMVDHNGAFPLADAVGYVLQIAEALAHAAERHVVHRDVKPSEHPRHRGRSGQVD